MRHRTLLSVLLMLLAVPAGVVVAQSGPEAAPGGVVATIELSQQFYYAGEPLFVRLSVGNDGGASVDNPVKRALLDGFRIKRDGQSLAGDPEKIKSSEPSRPAKLGPKTFYGTVVDLTRIFPEMSSPGDYEISWSADGVSSRSISVRLLPKYDPSRDYVATVETSAGSFKIEFYKNESPLATQAFIDMANAGFYDGLLIHEVRKDWYLAGGDPVASEVPRTPFTYPAETSSLPIVAGSVVLRPVRPYPPTNGSAFMVVLRPEPSWTGQVTVLGQVVEGLHVARYLSQVESNGEVREPFYRPVKDIRILTVSVSEKPPVPAG